jgi:hypothetical protein
MILIGRFEMRTREHPLSVTPGRNELEKKRMESIRSEA